jgi:hypothetical protein
MKQAVSWLPSDEKAKDDPLDYRGFNKLERILLRYTHGNNNGLARTVG